MGILGTSSMMSLFDVIIAVCGAYTIYSSITMKKTGKPGNWLMGSTDLSQCRDLKGFIDYIYGKTIVFGLIILAYGILGCVNSYVVSIGNFYYIGIAGMLIACVGYIMLLNKGKRMFL